MSNNLSPIICYKKNVIDIALFFFSPQFTILHVRIVVRVVTQKLFLQTFSFFKKQCHYIYNNFHNSWVDIFLFNFI